MAHGDSSLCPPSGRCIEEWDAGQITPQLFVGSVAAAQDCLHLLAHNFVHVVTTASRLQPQTDWTDEAYRKVKRTALDIEDHPLEDILRFVPKVIKVIDQVTAGEGKVLVHCASGVSRSVTCCMAWLMARQGHTSNSALELVRTSRRMAKPNFGFMQALQILEACNNDVEGARKRWKKANQSLRRDRNVASFRKTAEELHTRAQNFEEMLMAADLLAIPEKEVQSLAAQLEDLRVRCGEATPQDVIDDSVARSIREAVGNKAAALLSRLRKARPGLLHSSTRSSLGANPCSSPGKSSPSKLHRDGRSEASRSTAQGDGRSDSSLESGLSVSGDAVEAQVRHLAAPSSSAARCCERQESPYAGAQRTVVRMSL
mmetsp:Transcript_5125/g.12277  ORF Transcript_5125/g.12277 Transcript_5125/m.12277 type:complete len:372 (-) Transcript_5125:99-1214(-)